MNQSIKSFLLLSSIVYALLIFGYTSNNSLIAGITLVYFYYSVFTLWHELVHSSGTTKDTFLNKIFGSIAVAPLLIYDYETKKRLHLMHHAYTNDHLKDPDYSANNLIFKPTYKHMNRPKKASRTRISLCDMFIKSIFLLIIIFWILKYGLSLFILCSIMSFTFTHFIVNVYPHYKAQNFARDMGGSFFMTLLLLGNNYHASHHLNPNLPWTNFLKNATKN